MHETCWIIITMPGHDIIVIGASSGGVEVLTSLVRGLPEQLPAAIFVVLHVRPDAPSLLPAILNRVGVLPAAHAVDGEPIRTGRIYVAPPGMQMCLLRHRVSVERGPRENMHRPAIDPLFRTAAQHHGSRVIGVIASGALDDGTAGLQAVKDAGGIAVVQDPADAACASMPAHAMERVVVDHCVKASELSALLGRLACEPAPEPDARRQGPLDALDAQGETVEKALWTAVRSLEERSMLLDKLAENARARGHDGVAALFDDRSVALARDVRLLRELIARGRALEPTGLEGT